MSSSFKTPGKFTKEIRVRKDRRANPERRSRIRWKGYESDDRRTVDRGLLKNARHGVIYATSGALSTIGEWLDDHCRGEWRISLHDIDDDLIHKEVCILFESTKDYKAFRVMISKRREIAGARNAA